MARSARSRLFTRVTVAAVVVVVAAMVPRWWCGRGGAALFAGERAAQMQLADAAVATQGDDAVPYRTGSARFDGQSAIAIHQMTVLGLGQVVRQHPDLRPRYLPAMRRAADHLVDPRTHPYAASRYGAHGSVAMAPGQGHAYMGYINLALGMLRLVDPDTPHASLHDRVTAHLMRELDRSPHGMIETYPGEAWPPDVAAVVGSIGLHGEATGGLHAGLLSRWAERFRACAVHGSGYLYQRLAPGSCDPVDAPRGSGTAVAAYFLSFADRALAADLTTALAQEAAELGGFTALREYAPGFSGSGDTNAGPTVFGLSVGATGFGLGAARARGDEALFNGLYRTTTLFGAPSGSGHRYAVGGRLGNALLLAMLTATP